ncbi:ARID/BRIGHT DNA-binding domain [Macleaya cordata]|uniref:ARID/BRIGHT DNA-binding domain n=1 Tax=Macleaya cordata TaxID=56857 RepID=A0A200QEK0_MACCD|nr:ARID/BRIGHT DNA-binding domain [Macleaya cordata]
MSSSETETLSGNEVEEKRYPQPLASHEEVVKNRSVFMETLRRFHSVMGTKLMIPVIGGKELDLHILYVEVTKRGGFQKVVIEKKWRDVSTAFRLAPTATSASYVLRKHYLSLLHQYEQVYFFKLQGPLFTPTVALPVVKNLACRPASSSSDLIVSSPQSMQIQPYQIPEKKTKKSTFFPVLGTIDGKFDCGYLVSVKLGSEILRGVLYHPAEFDSASAAPTENAIVPYNPNPQPYTRKRRRRRRFEDPERPKPNRSGYNFFFSDKHSKLKSLYPNREREFTKMIGESWSNLSQEERVVYQNIGLKDKERYKRELKEYKEKLKLLQQNKEAGRTTAGRI